MGSFRPGAGNQHLHWYFNFTGCIVETASKSLRLSCGSELCLAAVTYWLPGPNILYTLCAIGTVGYPVNGGRNYNGPKVAKFLVG